MRRYDLTSSRGIRRAKVRARRKHARAQELRQRESRLARLLSSPITERDRLFFAIGILEGEGSFTVCPSNGRYRSARVCVKMNDPEPVHTVALAFGMPAPRQYRCSGHKPYWYAGTYGDKAHIVMRRLRSFLCARRRAQIARALRCS
jgi:hypothetical protein